MGRRGWKTQDHVKYRKREIYGRSYGSNKMRQDGGGKEWWLQKNAKRE